MERARVPILIPGTNSVDRAVLETYQPYRRCVSRLRAQKHSKDRGSYLYGAGGALNGAYLSLYSCRSERRGPFPSMSLGRRRADGGGD